MKFPVYCDNPPACTETYKPYSCSGSFGNPSFHALSCTSLTMYLLFDFLITREEIGQVERFSTDDDGDLHQLPPLYTAKVTKCSAFLILMVGLVYSFGIGLLRFVFEMTYVNQLTFGWFLGIWLACVFAFIIRVPFYAYIKKLLTDRQEIIYLREHSLKVAIMTFAMMLICIIQYYAMNGEEKTEQYITEYYNQTKPMILQCKNLDPEYYKPNTLFFGVDLDYSSAVICILTGYLGIIFQRIHFYGQNFIEVFIFDTKTKQFLRFVGRLIVMFLLGEGLFFILTKTIKPTQGSAIGLWEIYFIGVMIPYGVGSFLVFSIGDWICLKLKLYNHNELFSL